MAGEGAGDAEAQTRGSRSWGWRRGPGGRARRFALPERSGTPSPLSPTLTLTVAPLTWIEMRMSVPPYDAALPSRFRMICRTRPGSPSARTVRAPGCNCDGNVCR